MPWDSLACSLFHNKRPLLADKWCLSTLCIPNVGTLYSQRGNVTFPTWEYHVPYVGIPNPLPPDEHLFGLPQTKKQAFYATFMSLVCRFYVV